MMKRIRYLSLLMLLLCSINSWGQFDFNPVDPPEPGLPPMRLELRVSPSEAGWTSGSGTYAEGTVVPLRAYCYSGFVFDKWTDENGNTVSTDPYFAFTKGERAEVLTANYTFNPNSPQEPDDPVNILYYRLNLTTTEGGSVSGGGRYLAGASVGLSAYTNTGFDFDGWYDENGVCVSTSRYFNYVMPEGTTNLEARFTFNPNNPGEPDEPIVKHSVIATATEGGYTNFSMVRELTGTSVYLNATCNTGYRFEGWFLNGELYTTLSYFSYTIGTENVSFEARFVFDPDSPAEPGMPTTKKYAFYMMNMVTKPGTTVKFPVYLSSLANLGDMTFQLTFPEGLTPNLETVEMSDKTDGYTVSYNAVDANTYVFSLIGGSAGDGDYPLLVFSVDVPEDITTGQGYPIVINQVSVTEEDGNTVTASTRNGRISVYKLGDTNGDDVVDAMDVLNMVTVSLQKSTDTFIEEVSDINEDDEIDAQDVLGVVEIALEQ